MEEFNDQISIHSGTSIPKIRNAFKMYDNHFHILKSNTPSPLVWYKRDNQEQQAQQKFSKFKLQEIPPYPHKKEHVPQRNIQQ